MILRFVCLLFIFSALNVFYSYAAGVDSISVRPLKGTQFWALQDTERADKTFYSFVTAYEHRPFQVHLKSGARLKTVEHRWLNHLGLALPVPELDWQVGLDVPFAFAGHFYDPIAAQQLDSLPFFFGDATLSAKKVLIIPASDFSFALNPYLRLPTGDVERSMSTENLAGGLDGVVSYRFNQSLSFGGQAGLFLREPHSIGDAHFTHEIQYGMGARYNLPLAVVRGELTGKARMTKPFSDALENPLEVFLSAEKNIFSSYFVSAGSSIGLVRGSGAPFWRLFTGIQLR